jgi:Ca-activated chloride channel family protein
MKKQNHHPSHRLITGLRFLAILGLAGTAGLSAGTLRVDVGAGNPALPDYASSTTYIKVDLAGIRPEGIHRAPLNIALVIDRSGSMSGTKIEDAREAAIHVIRQLQRNDIVSVVAYSNSVEVLIPATKVADKRELISRIRQIRANGNTALFAGVSKGSAEVRKFLDAERINRVILLSDGLANVGPSSPAELARLGRSLGREGISVSTLGIGYGYNEDLMTRLAYESDGNHVFVSESSELADIFSQELGELFNVTAKEIRVRIRVSEDFEILRFLGREGEIRGRTAEVTLNQVADNQEKYVMLEVRHQPVRAPGRELYADVEVEYLDPFSVRRMQVNRQFTFTQVADENEVRARVDKEIIKDAALQIATIKSEKAVELRDEGQLAPAAATFAESSDYLRRVAEEYEIADLSNVADEVREDAEAVYDEDRWESKRKQLREEQNTVRTSQSIGSTLNRYLPKDPSPPATPEADPQPEE